jgi:hypothetical protein
MRGARRFAVAGKMRRSIVPDHAGEDESGSNQCGSHLASGA